MVYRNIKHIFTGAYGSDFFDARSRYNPEVHSSGRAEVSRRRAEVQWRCSGETDNRRHCVANCLHLTVSWLLALSTHLTTLSRSFSTLEVENKSRINLLHGYNYFYVSVSFKPNTSAHFSLHHLASSYEIWPCFKGNSKSVYVLLPEI